jgi:argininosuccinate lyase
LDDATLLAIHPKLSGEVREFLNVRGAIAARTSTNGTSPASVRNQLADLQKKIAANTDWASRERTRFSGMMGQ